MIALLIALALAQAEPTSTRCHFKSICATAGECDDVRGKTCDTASAATCAASRKCVVFGDCHHVAGKLFCRGDDPAACGPASAPCRLYGNCKAGKPGQFFCGPTAEGCAQSEDCKVNGLCGVGRSETGRMICLRPRRERVQGERAVP